MSLHEFLRQATAEHHQAVEIAMQSSRILLPDYTRPEYEAHLIRLWCGHRRASAMLVPQRQALAAAGFSWPDPEAWMPLESDLRGAGIAIPPRIADTAPLAEPAEGIGALYVLHGSSMGRAMVGNRLQPTLMAWSMPVQNYYNPQTPAAAQWRRFLKQLASLQDTDDLRERMAAGARKAFAAFLPAEP